MSDSEADSEDQQEFESQTAWCKSEVRRDSGSVHESVVHKIEAASQ